MRAVLDTNVLVSGLLSRKGAPGYLRRAIKQNAFTLCLSEAILDELCDVISRVHVRKVGKYSESEADEYITSLKMKALIVEPAPNIRAVEDDPDDDAILATALAANADVIVSGDNHLLSLGGSWRGIAIMTPREFLDSLDTNEA